VVAEREVRHAVEDRRLAGPEVEKPEPGADRLPGLLETFAFGAGDADRVGEPPPVAGERRAGAVGDDDRRIRVELPDPEFVLLVHTGDRVGEPPPVGREGPESEGFPLPVIGGGEYRFRVGRPRRCGRLRRCGGRLPGVGGRGRGGERERERGRHEVELTSHGTISWRGRPCPGPRSRRAAHGDPVTGVEGSPARIPTKGSGPGRTGCRASFAVHGPVAAGLAAPALADGAAHFVDALQGHAPYAARLPAVRDPDLGAAGVQSAEPLPAGRPLAAPGPSLALPCAAFASRHRHSPPRRVPPPSLGPRRLRRERDRSRPRARRCVRYPAVGCRMRSGSTPCPTTPAGPSSPVLRADHDDPERRAPWIGASADPNAGGGRLPAGDGARVAAGGPRSDLRRGCPGPDPWPG